MCYYHVNAILFITTATRMIDRQEKVREGGKERENKCLYKKNYTKCIILTPLPHKLMHDDKKREKKRCIDLLHSGPPKIIKRPKT